MQGQHMFSGWTQDAFQDGLGHLCPQSLGGFLGVKIGSCNLNRPSVLFSWSASGGDGAGCLQTTIPNHVMAEEEDVSRDAELKEEKQTKMTR